MAPVMTPRFYSGRNEWIHPLTRPFVAARRFDKPNAARVSAFLPRKTLGAGRYRFGSDPEYLSGTYDAAVVEVLGEEHTAEAGRLDRVGGVHQSTSKPARMYSSSSCWR